MTLFNFIYIARGITRVYRHRHWVRLVNRQGIFIVEDANIREHNFFLAMMPRKTDLFLFSYRKKRKKYNRTLAEDLFVVYYKALSKNTFYKNILSKHVFFYSPRELIKIRLLCCHFHVLYYIRKKGIKKKL